MAIATFVRHSGGFDKTLRLVQALSTIAMTFPDMAQWAKARDKVAFVRRLNRMFNWIDCFRIGQSSPTARYPNSIVMVKDVLMGVYLLMEMWTLPWVLTLVTGPLGKDLEIQANKFWFYSLSVAIMWDLWQLRIVGRGSSAAISKGNGKKESKTKDVPVAPIRSRSRLYRQLAADLCDLVLPAGAVGWIVLDPRIVGGMMVISTVAAGWGIWEQLEKKEQLDQKKKSQ